MVDFQKPGNAYLSVMAARFLGARSSHWAGKLAVSVVFMLFVPWFHAVLWRGKFTPFPCKILTWTRSIFLGYITKPSFKLIFISFQTTLVVPKEVYRTMIALSLLVIKRLWAQNGFANSGHFCRSEWVEQKWWHSWRSCVWSRFESRLSSDIISQPLLFRSFFYFPLYFLMLALFVALSDVLWEIYFFVLYLVMSPGSTCMYSTFPSVSHTYTPLKGYVIWIFVTKLDKPVIPNALIGPHLR